MTGWKVAFLSAAVAALMLQDTASITVGPLCNNGNGDCADDQVCVQVTISCSRAPCPQYAVCVENLCNNFIKCAPGTTCHVNEKTGGGECINDICALEPDSGPCLAYFPSYFFNTASFECEKFIYGGCGGNENRFFLLESCRKTCEAS